MGFTILKINKKICVFSIVCFHQTQRVTGIMFIICTSLLFGCSNSYEICPGWISDKWCSNGPSFILGHKNRNPEGGEFSKNSQERQLVFISHGSSLACCCQLGSSQNKLQIVSQALEDLHQGMQSKKKIKVHLLTYNDMTSPKMANFHLNLQ